MKRNRCKEQNKEDEEKEENMEDVSRNKTERWEEQGEVEKRIKKEKKVGGKMETKNKEKLLSRKREAKYLVFTHLIVGQMLTPIQIKVSLTDDGFVYKSTKGFTYFVFNFQ